MVDPGITDINIFNALFNINVIVTTYLQNAPSDIESIACFKCIRSKTFHSTTIVFNIQNRIQCLEDYLQMYVTAKKLGCSKCAEVMNIIQGNFH